jgi:hypothetical protein
MHTLVNGQLVYTDGLFPQRTYGERLLFNR